MIALRLIACSLALVILTSLDVSALTFDKIFFAGDGANGRLGEARTQFSPDESRIYLRFIYRDGQPGQKLIAYWRILEDVKGRKGQFAKSEMILEKSADKGQFSFNAEEPWNTGRYRVTITDSDNIILEEMDFQVVTDRANENSRAGDSFQLFDEQTEELPPSILEQLKPKEDTLSLSRLFTTGRKKSTQYSAKERTIYARFEYDGAAKGQTVDAIWEHTGQYGTGGIGVFARDQLSLIKQKGRAQFSFSPKPAGSWLSGDYKIILLSNNRIIGESQFNIKTPPGSGSKYQEIVTIVSSRLGFNPQTVNQLYQSNPALFSNLKGLTTDIRFLEDITTTSPESQFDMVNWGKRPFSSDPLNNYLSALRSYRVSLGLIPNGVTPPKAPAKLIDTYLQVRSSLPAKTAYDESLKKIEAFSERKTLYGKILKAKGETENSASKSLTNYLQGKTDLYWENLLELHFQHSRLQSNKKAINQSLWQNYENDLKKIRISLSG